MGIKQRLYPETGQVVGLIEHCHHARFVFNIGLEQRAMWRRSKHDRGRHPEFGELNAARITTATQMRELTELRQTMDWLNSGSAVVQQGALRDLDRAFQNFYSARAGHPIFKRKSDRAGSFVVRDLAVRRLNRRWGVVTVPKVGRVRFRISRTWAEIERATSARITQKNGRWHVSFTTPPAKRIAADTGAAVGIDRGVKNTLATSDGCMMQTPDLTAAEKARFAALQQRLARQRKGSARRGVTLNRLAGLRCRLEDRRTNWVEEASTSLARRYDFIAVEDLRVSNMVRRPAPRADPEHEGVFLLNGARAKGSLNRAILASLWGRFLTRLEQKLPEGAVVRVDPKDTSRTCAACGHCAPGNRQSQAVFECEACGHVAHADTNAAINILARAIATQAPGHGASGRVRPAVHAGGANQPAA